MNLNKLYIKIPKAILSTNVKTVDGNMNLETLVAPLVNKERILEVSWTTAGAGEEMEINTFHLTTNKSLISLLSTPYGKVIIKNDRNKKRSNKKN